MSVLGGDPPDHFEGSGGDPPQSKKRRERPEDSPAARLQWTLNNELFRALAHQRTDVVETLLKEGADPNAAKELADPRFEAGLPLRIAVENTDTASVLKLVEYGAKPKGPSRSTPPILIAIERKDSEMLHLLLRLGATLDVGRKFKILGHAISSGNLEAARLIFERVPLDKMGTFDLIDIAKSTPEIVEWAMDKGWVDQLISVSPNSNLSQAFVDAVFNRHRVLVDLLLKAEIAPASPPVQIAVFNNDIPMVRLLLEAGYNPTETAPHTKTSLEMAVDHGNAEMVLLLIDFGALPPSTTMTHSFRLRLLNLFERPSSSPAA